MDMGKYENAVNRERAEKSDDSVNTKDVDPSEIKILIVEDTDINRIILSKLLLGMKFKVETCTNGLEALEILDKNDFDLILMDVEMPKMDGLTTTRKIREKEKQSGKHVPIIAVTAKRDPDECFAAGMDAFVPKLINGKELTTTIFHYYEKFRTPKMNQDNKKAINLNLEDLPVFCKEKVLENLMGDNDLLDELISMFSVELPDFSAKIMENFKAGNLSEVKKSAHRLKGAAGFSGARRIERIAQEMQHLSENEDAYNIEFLINNLEEEKTRFLKIIESKSM